MIKITNGENVFEVSNGAFEGIYSKQGYYKIVDTTVVSETALEDPEEQEKTEEELFVDGVIEKPLSQWNKEEVKRFAELNAIDISGTKNVGEAKGLIKDFLGSNM